MYNCCMRHIGIDYGAKRVGVALSDETNSLAFPHSVAENGDGLVGEIGRIAAENGVGRIVVGESKDYQGNDNEIMGGILRFKSDIESVLGLEVVLEPEFLTSAEASRATGDAMLDASAAAIILQSYLDKKKNEHDKHR